MKPMMDNARRRLQVSWGGRTVRPGRIIGFLILIVFAIIMMYPIYYMVSSSLRSNAEYAAGNGWSLSSWAQLMRSVPVLREAGNSAVITVSSVLLILVVSVPAGFAFAKESFRGRRLALLAISACILVPVVSIIIPEYVNLSRIGLVTGYFGAILVYTGIGTPFSVFLVTTYFRSFPDQLFEAARIDGASSLQILWEFVLPLARPVMFTIGILEFIIVWDDLLVAVLMVQNPSQRTFTTGLALISSGHFTSTPVLLAGSVVSVLPATIVFIVFQKYLVQGLTAGIER